VGVKFFTHSGAGAIANETGVAAGCGFGAASAVAAETMATQAVKKMEMSLDRQRENKADGNNRTWPKNQSLRAVVVVFNAIFGAPNDQTIQPLPSYSM
jgi:hypothetical protein